MIIKMTCDSNALILSHIRILQMINKYLQNVNAYVNE